MICTRKKQTQTNPIYYRSAFGVHRAANSQIINSIYGVYSFEFVVNLKKQSQFAGVQIEANSFLKGNYNNMPPFGAQKNKANLPAFTRKSEYLNPKY
jgi:hypothetical protein